MDIKAKEEKTVYVVYTNTDLTEGRGHEYPIAVCEMKSTARRLAHKKGVQGTDATVNESKSYLIRARWYGPVSMIKPSKEDVRASFLQNERDSLIERLNNSNMDKGDIDVLTNAMQRVIK